ncbi:MFS transporter [Aspergillus alliaceus]|uniref:MFS transporter n=1 Tax=Petromyces alliaceus TaxID=209559 RepID=UPI0012A69C0C|nr:major facilitator superfamily domain-containing protein [Aspergillus alliaceus]KAB8235167.1 major facilitator superfamily domain-containing protein [Aspergillus alliaceus]
MTTRYVDFEGPDDPSIPFNWSIGKRVYLSVLLGLLTMVVAMASSIFTSAIPTVIMMYKIDREVATLGVSLYVLGFATGPLCWAPFSELKGRKLPLVTSTFGFTVFCFATAVSKDLQSLMILRYFTGFFGAGPLTLSGAVYADIFPPHQRGIAMVGFCLMVFTGPLTAPFIGGIIFVLLFLTLNETYEPVLLSWKAYRLRREHDDWSVRAKHEEVQLDMRSIITNYISLPLKMLAFDPIVLCMSVFASFVHHMNPGVGGLPYIGIIVGQLLGALGVFAMQPWVLRKMERNGGLMLPEWRLPVAIPGAVAFSAGLFWLGWSGYRRSVSWVVPTISGLLTGFGLLTMFLSSIAYLVEARPKRAASAVAAHTFLRSLAGAIFPLFAFYMFDSLGIQWACTVLGCVAAVLIPMPLLLYLYGIRIRSRSGLEEDG